MIFIDPLPHKLSDHALPVSEQPVPMPTSLQYQSNRPDQSDFLESPWTSHNAVPVLIMRNCLQWLNYPAIFCVCSVTLYRLVHSLSLNPCASEISSNPTELVC
ncbi:hypothetical protein JTE90_023126 [Oedothorax gibbosus]|uniref:Uncharacterized protein n=1 Tax=Oedothorax gibbosus TaxID=931172 RepID=A0AAV6UP39_9ARAC|nr:hypothetical protein JTE90_023126 [Oedothorax gibbosus]